MTTVRGAIREALRRAADRLEPRAPRLKGFSVDDGVPDRGKRYGGTGTIHNTGTVDVILTPGGDVAQLWFRCRMLPFRVSPYTRDEVVQDTGEALVAVEFVDREATA